VFTILAYGYPYVLLTSLTTWGLVLLLGRWKLLALYSVVLLLGWNLHTQFYAIGSQKKDAEDSFKIMSYNVRAFDLYENMGLGPNLIRDSILDYLAAEAPDIICFQEFFYETNTRQFMTLARIKEGLNLPYHAGSFLTGKDNKTFFGCAIFSKKPIINQGSIDLQTKSSNHCVFADIQMDSAIIRIYNFHIGSISFNEADYAAYDEFGLDLNDVDKGKAMNLIRRFLKASRDRVRQLRLVLEHAATTDYPTVLCGDLNDTPSSYAYKQLKTKYTDAFQEVGKGLGRTYVGHMPANRIDYVFYDKYFAAINFTLQKETLSDHKAVGARMMLK
jgi:endonuclease/exonuclease/phosphatase family metal-dependent hydrolase